MGRMKFHLDTFSCIVEEYGIMLQPLNHADIHNKKVNHSVDKLTSSFHGTISSCIYPYDRKICGFVLCQNSSFEGNFWYVYGRQGQEKWKIRKSVFSYFATHR